MTGSLQENLFIVLLNEISKVLNFIRTMESKNWSFLPLKASPKIVFQKRRSLQKSCESIELLGYCYLLQIKNVRSTLNYLNERRIFPKDFKYILVIRSQGKSR